jgi:protein-disulfide isomerase
MAACVYEQSNDAFWSVHDALFSRQQEITANGLADLVDAVIRQTGDLNAHHNCVSEHKMAERINRDLEFAKDHNIEGPPTIFVNGPRLDGVVTAKDLQAAINKAASETGSGQRH